MQVKKEEKIDPYVEAIMAAQKFIESCPPTELGIYTLRKAFEKGFLKGYTHAKHSK